jgi:hypothetical protein
MKDKERICDESVDPFYDQIEKGFINSFPDSRIRIHDSHRVLVKQTSLCSVVLELVTNCLEQGAVRVEVDIEPGRVSVEDDISHSQDELEGILANITSARPRSTKGPDPDLGGSGGGGGIFSVRRMLDKHEGCLAYETIDDGRIRAVASWPTESKL